jgi:hypothetical protein
MYFNQNVEVSVYLYKLSKYHIFILQCRGKNIRNQLTHKKQISWYGIPSLSHYNSFSNHHMNQ